MAPPTAASNALGLTSSLAAAGTAKARPSAVSKVVAPAFGPTQVEGTGKAPAYVHDDATRAIATRPATPDARPDAGSNGLRVAATSSAPVTTVVATAQVAPYEGAVGSRTSPTRASKGLAT